ncbi:MAG: hypothetical protein WCC89_06085, partial [Candidatus Sulfotelmatobacter sp.]
TPKFAICVDQHGDDSVGIQVAFALKDAIAKSARYVLTDEEKNSIIVDLVTADRFFDEQKGWQPARGSASYISVLVYLNAPPADHPGAPANVVLHHHLMLAGSENSREAGERILATVDKAMAIVTKAGGK